MPPEDQQNQDGAGAADQTKAKPTEQPAENVDHAAETQKALSEHTAAIEKSLAEHRDEILQHTNDLKTWLQGELETVRGKAEERHEEYVKALSDNANRPAAEAADQTDGPGASIDKRLDDVMQRVRKLEKHVN